MYTHTCAHTIYTYPVRGNTCIHIPSEGECGHIPSEGDTCIHIPSEGEYMYTYTYPVRGDTCVSTP